MNYNYFTGREDATASISINRNKLRSYSGNYYLKDRQEFEIELFNPSSNTKLAKITINGKDVSSSGIVVKPGQRIYLERFIDVPKKFIFETYIIDRSDKDAITAITRNGKIEVSFYDEATPLTYNQYYHNNSHLHQSGFGGSTGTYSGIVGTTTTSYSSSTDTFSPNINSVQKETGRIEQGSSSNHSFSQYSGSFNYWTANVVYIHLFPFSEKPVEIRDLAEYCTECGTRNKKGNYKYCPSCGNKF